MPALLALLASVVALVGLSVYGFVLVYAGVDGLLVAVVTMLLVLSMIGVIKWRTK